MKQNRDLRNKPTYFESINFFTKPRIYNREKWSLQQMILGKLDIHMQKNETGLLSSYTKINSKCIEDLKVRHEITKLLEENIRGKLFNVGLGGAFFFILKAKATNEKHMFGTASTKKLFAGVPCWLGR